MFLGIVFSLKIPFLKEFTMLKYIWIKLQMDICSLESLPLQEFLTKNVLVVLILLSLLDMILDSLKDLTLVSPNTKQSRTSQNSPKLNTLDWSSIKINTNCTMSLMAKKFWLILVSHLMSTFLHVSLTISSSLSPDTLSEMIKLKNISKNQKPTTPLPTGKKKKSFSFSFSNF